MNAFSHVPPGFRFHPTDEELVYYYLRKKVQLKRIDLDIIKDIDLYKIEPWDLQERCKIGTEDQNDWFFFSHKDKKYPTGTRTNRATPEGFWKATGRDKPIYVKHCLVGMRKTLVFYKGRAPNGQKLDWIMHEYRLETNENGAPHDEGWVVCKVFKKRVATVQRMATADSPFWFNHDHVAFMAPRVDSPRQGVHHLHNAAYHHGHHQTYHHPCKVELEYHHLLPQEPASFLQLPQLEIPRLPDLIGAVAASLQPCSQTHGGQASRQLEIEPVYVTDASAGEWRDLDKFMASQLSHDGATPKGSSGYANPALAFQAEGKHEEALDYVSASAYSGGDNGLWK